MQSKNLIRCAAAGSGKTWGICRDALKIIRAGSNKRVLIVTYTNKGVEAIETEFKKQNFGVLDRRVVICSWYHFILYDLIKPYQTCLTNINEIKSLDFSELYGKRNFGKSGTKERYMNWCGNVKANYASEMAFQLNYLSENRVIKRLEMIYSSAYFDEIQDLAGYDFNIIELLMDSAISTTCVGDNKQATFKTHNTQKGKKQTGINIWFFFNDLQIKGKADIENNLCSRRFNKAICEFANLVFPNENNITTCMEENTEHDGVFLVCRRDIEEYYNHFKPTVLKYDKNTQTDVYQSLNFGQCKGLTFDRVLIYPNKPLRDFIDGKPLKSEQKYYVAVTRPKYSLAIVLDELPTNVNYKIETIQLQNNEIIVMRFVEDN